MTNRDALICFLGFIGVIGLILVIRSRKPTILPSSDSAGPAESNGNREMLERRLNEYLNKTTAYYLQMKLRSMGAPIEKLREIENLYGRELAMPVLELSDLHALPDVGNHIGDWGTSFLKKKGINRKAGQSEWVWLNRSISDHSRQEAERLLKKEMP